MLLFILGIFSSIFWAVIIAILLWVLCFFAGKILNPNFTMSIIQHLVSFVIAIPTIILLVVFFMCNKAHRMVEKVDTTVANILMTDLKFTDRLQTQITKASKTGDADDLTDYLADNFSEKIASENPMLKKYIDVNQILKKTDLGEQISELAQGGNVVAITQQIIQTTASSFTSGIKSKIKSVRRKMLFITIFLQAIPFGIVLFSASKHQNPVQSYTYNSEDY